MRKIIAILFIVACSVQLNAQGRLKANFDFHSFYIPGNQGYLETYLEVIGESVVFMRNENNMLQSKLQLSWKFINDKKEIVHFDKYILHSPEVVEDGSIDFPN